jgi:hypothetical protein
VDGVAKDKISKVLGLNTLQGLKHNATDVGEEEAAPKAWQAKVWARDHPTHRCWYAHVSHLCHCISFSIDSCSNLCMLTLAV